METDRTIQIYNNNAEQFASEYESLAFESVHAEALEFLQRAPAAVLDVGAGSGRDAAWFAERGCDVVAVEPAAQMIVAGKALHPDARIRWVQDKLPELKTVMRLGLSFDIILLSAVWMHVHEDDRQRSFRKLISLLKAGGIMVISLRHGPISGQRQVYPGSVSEIERLAGQYGIAVVRTRTSADQLGRDDVQWETVCLQLPDDGTQSLPLLRHTILNDSKSSTYKLALLRVLVRIANSAVGIVRDNGDDTVSVPLGLVALYWIRMYKPLIESGIAQKPASKDNKGLGFVREAFLHVSNLSPYELRVGGRFTGSSAQWLHNALIDAAKTIHTMPANYIRYPNSDEQIFKTIKPSRLMRADPLVLNDSLFWSMGELAVPRQLWLTMIRFASWIEPVVLSEWTELMRQYEGSHGRNVSLDALHQALSWREQERNTTVSRTIAQRLLEENKSVFCVWTGKKLTIGDYDIDHCFPFSAWPCGDLWNLLPANRQVNQRQKGDKLVTAISLERARERILEWWHEAYICGGDYLEQRFVHEASVALPVLDDRDEMQISGIFDALVLKRAALKQDMQLIDWDG
jgi:SAM-dependent methyltransferase